MNDPHLAPGRLKLAASAGEARRPVIGIDISSLLKSPTGVGHYTQSLIRALIERKAPLTYRLWANALRGELAVDAEIAAGAEIKRSRIPGKALLNWWRRFPWPCVEDFTGPIELFHSPNFYFQHVRKAKTVATIHDLFFLRFPELTERYGGKYWAEVLPRRIHELDAIIAVSQSTARDITELLGIPSSRIRVIPEGADPFFFEEVSGSAASGTLRTLEIGRPFFLAVGTLEPRKNYPFLLQEFALWRQQSKQDVLLVIAGPPGWGGREVLQVISDLNAASWIRLVHYLDRKALAALYHQALALLFPSRYEGFGLPLLEAMACGAPVIANNTSSIPEVVGEAGLLFNADQPGELAGLLTRICEDDDLRRILIAKGAARVREFSWESAAAETEKLYFEIL